MTAALKTGDLSKEALAFVRGENPIAQVKREPAATLVEIPPSEPTTEQVEPAVVSRAQAKGVVRSLPTMVGLSTRVPAELHEKLMRASFERKLERRQPWTHQDILTEALSSWLKKAGYP